jgi:hypothetical protein
MNGNDRHEDPAGLPRQTWTSGLRAAIDSQRHKGDGEPPRRVPRLGQVLVRSGYVSDEDINRALAAQAKSGKLIGEILVEQGAVSRPIVRRALEEQSSAGPDAEGGLFSGLRGALGMNGPKPDEA